MKNISYYQTEYPRPQLWRPSYLLLNGVWSFAFGDDVTDEQMHCGFSDKMNITVPFTYQTELSGIGREERHDVVWYSRQINIDEQQLSGRVLLHLEGCDYQTFVWVNGIFVGGDFGGYHRKNFDCTSALHSGENNFTIKACDDYSVEKPRGKQSAKDANYGCWYTDTTEIYKTAWMEFVPSTYLKNVIIESDAEQGRVTLDCHIEGESNDTTVRAEVTYEGKSVAVGIGQTNGGRATLNIGLTDDEPIHLWQLSDPSLYEVKITIFMDGVALDNAQSYFGIRTIETKNGKIYLNNKELYQRLALDQGYWRESLLTPPSEQALIDDITYMADMGFNGVRKHQKVEDERYLYYADIMGFIVWAEMPSMYAFTEDSQKNFEREWLLSVEQQRNHPCVFAWVPFNESWGVEHILTDKAQQDFVNRIYYQTKAIDASRPDQDWEKIAGTGTVDGSPFINEGPYAFCEEGRVFVAYSGSSSWCTDYCIALLELVGEDPMDSSSWKKHHKPVASKNDRFKGMGYCSVIEEEKLIFFHAWRTDEKNIVWNTVYPICAKYRLDGDRLIIE